MQSHQLAKLNLLWGSLILEELARLGVQHICMAPGSRSTPLTLAAAKQDKLKQHIHFDERGLGFLALGLAKSSRAPVAIITTSGTAVANLYPAIVEAWLTKVPLIVLSGDRPPELIDCGANQAIIQPGIFMHYAKQINLPTPDTQIAPQALLSQIDIAVTNQQQPLHINCMYREPLYPAEISQLNIMAEFTDYLFEIKQWQYHNHPYLQVAHHHLKALPNAAQLAQFSQAKGVIVAGTLSPEQSPQELIDLADILGWPLLTDAQCQLRQHPQAINHIDQLLHLPQVKAILAEAEHVLVIGGRLLSKRLISYLEQHKWRSYWQVLPQQERLDQSNSAKQLFLGTAADIANLPWPSSNFADWAQNLTELNQQLEQFFIQHIDDGEFGEAKIIRAITSQQTNLNQLFIGNSLPVRLFDMFAPIKQHTACTYTNRGASGIDGLLATACGVAADKMTATTLIIGDISQLHDLNSFAIASKLQSPMVIVILNNDGGNIFNLLPVPSEQVRQDYYRLSHGFEFGYAAAMFNLPYNRVESIEDFNDAYQEAISYEGCSVIEVIVAPQQSSTQIANIAQWIKQA